MTALQAEAAKKLAVIAGAGHLPRRLVDAAKKAGREVVVLTMKGVSSPADYADVMVEEIRLGELGRPIRKMKAAGVQEFCMFGPVPRPNVMALGLDARALAMVPKLARRGWGDDAILSLIIEEIEKEGMAAIGAHEIDPTLLAGAGRIAGPEPDAQAEADIARGFAVAKALGEVDVGQGVVVQAGLVLALEAIEGTDRMLERCGPLGRSGAGGVLVKAAKPTQDRRADLPTIGGRTLRNAKKAGLRGIAIEAEAALVIDDKDFRLAAAETGLFVVAREWAHG